MDRIERRKKRSDFANEPEVSERDAPLLVTPQGREPGAHNAVPSVADEEIAAKTPGVVPRSEVTGPVDQGGDEETDDGLNASAEAVRRAAEDVPVGEESEKAKDCVPVFDRGEAPPKV